jgi:hypothetical protein
MKKPDPIPPGPTPAQYAGSIARYLALNGKTPDLPDGANKATVELEAFTTELDRQADEARRIAEEAF